MGTAQSPESVIPEISRRTRKKYGTEEKIQIVLERLKGEVSIEELCRKENLNPNVYYTHVPHRRTHAATNPIFSDRSEIATLPNLPCTSETGGSTIRMYEF